MYQKRRRKKTERKKKGDRETGIWRVIHQARVRKNKYAIKWPGLSVGGGWIT
jgi:hypothetical protein